MADTTIEIENSLVETKIAEIVVVESCENFDIFTESNLLEITVSPEVIVVEVTPSTIQTVQVDVGIPAPSVSIHKMLWSSTQW